PAPPKKAATPAGPAVHAQVLRDLRSQRRKPMMRAVATTASQANAFCSSQGATRSADVAAKPASARPARTQRFCQSGQKTKNGATKSSWPLSIPPAASKQPHQNQRLVMAASAANK